MYDRLNLPVHPFLLLPLLCPCIHSLWLCVYSCTENWCSLKPLCLCMPQKPLHPATITLAPVACFVHIRSSGVQGSTSTVLLNLSMIPSNFDQISLGSDNWKLVIENDLKTSGAPNYKLHASPGLEGKGSMGIIENQITQHNRLIWKDPDAGKDWREEKGMTENGMVGWHHWLNGHGFGWTPGVGDGQGGLACCGSWGRKESDMTERLNWTEHNRQQKVCLPNKRDIKLTEWVSDPWIYSAMGDFFITEFPLVVTAALVVREHWMDMGIDLKFCQYKFRVLINLRK